MRRPAGRRAPLEAGAARVRRLMAADGLADDAGREALAGSPTWGTEARALLALRDAESRDYQVELPSHISASLLVGLGEDPAAVTRQLRRPVPQRPGMSARAGTAFHGWVEEFYATTGQLDLDEEPSADYFVDRSYGLEGLQETFRRSQWAQRTPAEIEVPIETMVAGVVVRGRIDAIFRDADGGWDLIDWKTGAVPGPAALRTRSVQLAAYRLAWARLHGIGLDKVRAAFYYVAQDRLVRPVDLAGEAELEAIIAAATQPPD
jgi:DNA helicase-2/ATP-dependent DNA helicase PcrA